MNYSNKAQGTIEYLVVLAIIIVISLIVVVILSGTFSDSSSQIDASSTKLGGQMSGSLGISIIDSSIDSGGDGILQLKSSSGEAFSITQISAIGADGSRTDLSYNPITVLPTGDVTVGLNGISSQCPCSSGKARENCSFEFTYSFASGLIKTQTINTVVNCVADAVAVNPEKLQQPIGAPVSDTNSPVISGTDPSLLAFGTTSYDLTITTDENATCKYSTSAGIAYASMTNTYTGTLLSHSATISGLATGINYIYTKCSDVSSNANLSDFITTITVLEGVLSFESCWSDTTNPHPICTCSDLNKVREHIDWDYTILNDVNCYETRQWNNGSGFEPIGAGASNGYYGHFDGNNKSISGLYINRPGQEYGIGLFSSLGAGLYPGNGVITSLSLIDVNIIGGNGNYGIGALAGSSFAVAIQKSSSTGVILGNTNYCGGLIGAGGESTLISNSYSMVNIAACGWYAGGLVGRLFASQGISNSYSIGEVNGTNAGGLVGIFDNYSSITNSFSTGRIIGSTTMGGLAGRLSYHSTITGSYWDITKTSMSTCVGSGVDPVEPIQCQGINDSNSGYATWWYDSSKGPLSSWDFVNTWQENLDSYPTLRNTS